MGARGRSAFSAGGRSDLGFSLRGCSLGACLDGFTLAAIAGSSTEVFAGIDTAAFSGDLGAVGGAINSTFESDGDAG